MTIKLLLVLVRKVFLAGLLLSLMGCLEREAWVNDADTSSAHDKSGSGLPVASHVDEIEIINVPETGISLGWGWNSFDNQTIPSICVEFVEGNEPAQTQTVDIKEVTDNYEVSKHIGGSTEGSYSGYGVKVSGSASFARDVNINSSSTNFLLTASVQNGVRYAAPVPAANAVAPAGVELVTPRGGTSGEVRLTEQALKLAKLRDISRFQQACGDSFVSSVYSGAKLTAVISIRAESRSGKQRMSASVNGSGWGATLNAKGESSESSDNAHKDSSVSVLLTGGRNEAIPTNVEEVIAMSKRLAIAAYEAPKDFHMAITPYETLSNWPGREMLGAETEFDQLADRWGFYISLYDEIQDVLDNPQLYRWPWEENATAEDENTAKESTTAENATPPKDCEINEENLPEHCTEHLKNLQDEILLISQALDIEARRCTADAEDLSDNKECEFDHLRYPDPFHYRVQLPPPLAILIIEKDREDILKDLPPFITDTLQQQVVHKAKIRCQLDVNNLGCLSNADIDELGELIDSNNRPLCELDLPADWLKERLECND